MWGQYSAGAGIGTLSSSAKDEKKKEKGLPQRAQRSYSEFTEEENARTGGFCNIWSQGVQVLGNAGYDAEFEIYAEGETWRKR